MALSCTLTQTEIKRLNESNQSINVYMPIAYYCVVNVTNKRPHEAKERLWLEDRLRHFGTCNVKIFGRKPLGIVSIGV